MKQVSKSRGPFIKDVRTGGGGGDRGYCRSSPPNEDKGKDGVKNSDNFADSLYCLVRSLLRQTLLSGYPNKRL